MVLSALLIHYLKGWECLLATGELALSAQSCPQSEEHPANNCVCVGTASLLPLATAATRQSARALGVTWRQAACLYNMAFWMFPTKSRAKRRYPTVPARRWMPGTLPTKLPVVVKQETTVVTTSMHRVSAAPTTPSKKSSRSRNKQSVGDNVW